VEFVAKNADGVDLVIGDFDACRIDVGINFGSHLEAGGGGGDQLDDGLMTLEWFATPVLCDEREQAMLDPVPLAGAGRQMTDRDGNAEFRWLTKFCSSRFQRRTPTPLLPPQSAVIRSFVACG
jgi:hypothetical protein